MGHIQGFWTGAAQFCVLGGRLKPATVRPLKFSGLGVVGGIGETSRTTVGLIDPKRCKHDSGLAPARVGENFTL